MEGVSARQAKANDTDHTKPCNSSFFKIIASPSIQLQNLRIPCAFIDKFGKSLSSDHAYLRVPDGAEWKVYLKKHEGDVSFDEGWSEFANRYSLALGQFIVFKYQGNSEFEVIIFDITGTEIVYAQTTTINTTETDDHSSVGMHGETSSALERAMAFESSNPHFSIVVRPFHLRQPFYFSVPLWYAREQMTKKEKKSAMRLRVRGKTWPVNCCFGESHGNTKVYVRWKSFACDNGLKEGDVCVLELINETTKTYKVTIFRD